ncbi:hypothetical protein K469DRAFT_710633 [Zopfia rhizophila CBS 207.26]|uniref:Uncharacterized protein n=1 Tax=Zopfia rhizophila CBS 207.26 TaxID=1314779 RepID=A0A6A6DZ51_9PEZI|nr:hypothetical protein K469DRAFT_710633 [Zopfia rhizophila CBS 207.26]
MATKLLILFAASATAQLTTSFWMPKIYLGTERISYVASVVGADQDRLTLAASPANDTDYEALGLATGSTDTYTFASTLFEYSTSEMPRNVAGASSGEYAYSFKCEMQTADAEADCTVSYGPGIARGRCNTRSIPGYTSTQLWTFSDTDTAGVETIVRSFPGSPNTPIPDWCNEGSDAPVPSSALINDAPFQSTYFGTYEFIITAGEEKVSATTGGVVSTSSVEPTGSQASSGGTGSTAAATGAEGTGEAAPMNTVAPALAGLAAVAVFFL